MFLCFINYSTLTTDQRIQATLMQNLFENVHTVREEEATWWQINSDRPFTDPTSVSHECNYLSTRSVKEINYSMALTSISLNQMPLL